jgi:hypothetical protein
MTSIYRCMPNWYLIGLEIYDIWYCTERFNQLPPWASSCIMHVLLQLSYMLSCFTSRCTVWSVQTTRCTVMHGELQTTCALAAICVQPTFRAATVREECYVNYWRDLTYEVTNRKSTSQKRMYEPWKYVIFTSEWDISRVHLHYVINSDISGVTIGM